MHATGTKQSLPALTIVNVRTLSSQIISFYWEVSIEKTGLRFQKFCLLLKISSEANQKVVSIYIPTGISGIFAIRLEYWKLS